MRKFVLLVVAALLSASALAQVNSHDGKADGTPHFNFAHRDITIKADYPDQVRFSLPQAVFNINMNQLVPNASVNINIRVRNLSDRAIQVSDINSYVPLGGFSLSWNPLTVAAGGEGWFTYTITTGDVDQLQLWLSALATNPLPSHVTFNSSTNVMTVQTALQAEGVFPAEGSDSFHNF